MNTVNSNTFQNLKNKFNHIYSKNMVFRELARSDGFPLFTATQNPDFNKHLLWVAPEQELDIFSQIDKLIRENTLNQAVVLSICDKYTGAWAGMARVKGWKDGMEMGILLHPNYWGGKYVFSAAGPIFECMVNTFTDIPLYIRMRAENQKVKKLADYYNFQKEDEIVEESHATEGLVEVYSYKMNKDTRTPYTEISDY